MQVEFNDVPDITNKINRESFEDWNSIIPNDIFKNLNDPFLKAFSSLDRHSIDEIRLNNILSKSDKNVYQITVVARIYAFILIGGLIASVAKSLFGIPIMNKAGFFLFYGVLFTFNVWAADIHISNVRNLDRIGININDDQGSLFDLFRLIVVSKVYHALSSISLEELRNNNTDKFNTLKSYIETNYDAILENLEGRLEELSNDSDFTRACCVTYNF